MIKTETRPAIGFVPVADALAGTKSSATLNMKNFQTFHAFLLRGAGATGTSTVIVEKCSASNGTGNEAIPFVYRKLTASGDSLGAWTAATTAGFATSAAADDLYEVAVDQQMEGLAEGDKPYVRVTCAEVVDSPVLAGCLLLGSGGRYGRAG